jgi:hypothetical protein
MDGWLCRKKGSALRSEDTLVGANSLTQLDAVMARCLEMSQQGKISKANCWQLDFIESLPALVTEEANRSTVNIHKGNLGKLGMSVGVASAVYGYRVDSLLETIYNTLDSKSKGPAEDAEGVF